MISKGKLGKETVYWVKLGFFDNIKWNIRSKKIEKNIRQRSK